jgi:tetratricopeptide (TPR) repeat protein
MKMLKLAKAKLTSGICTSLFLTFALIPSSLAAKSGGEYRQLGLLYRQQGRFPEAITAMQKSVELDPKNIMGRVNLGWTQHLAGHEKDAAISLWQAIYQEPLFVPAYNALGIVYLVDGNVPVATLVHAWAAILKPNNEIAYFNLSLSLHRLQVYNFAIICAERAATLEPNNPHPLVAAAIAYWDNGDKDAAKQIYTKAIQLDSRYRDRSFLSHLKQAAFTQEQIERTEQILTAM